MHLQRSMWTQGTGGLTTNWFLYTDNDTTLPLNLYQLACIEEYSKTEYFAIHPR